MNIRTSEVSDGRCMVCLPACNYVCTYVAACVCVLDSVWYVYFTDVPKNEARNLIMQWMQFYCS